MNKVHQCALALEQFFLAAQKNDWETATLERNNTTRLEHEADDLKISIRIQLPKSIFLPVPRSDLLELVSVQDHIANIARDITGIMLGRKITFPESMHESMAHFVHTCVQTSAQALKAIRELDELIETGFSNREAERIEVLIRHLNELEKNSDTLQIDIRAQLFEIEDSLPPVDVMFLYNVIERIGELANSAERVGSRLQILIAR
jgi:hypothetical protein